MKRHIIILLLMGLMPIHLLARTISREEAANFALQFLSDGESEPELAPMLLNTDEEDLFAEEGHEYMYLVQTIDDGWVVMPTDDRFPPVLAKGDGIFYPFHDSIPPAMRALLEGYVSEMKYVIDSTNYTTTNPKWNWFEYDAKETLNNFYGNALSGARKSLLDTIRWGQAESNDDSIPECYNKFCPNGWFVPNRNKKCLAGCTAVAMAQVMRYWQWPHSANIPKNINYGGIISDETILRIYNWISMPGKLRKSTPIAEIDEVAKVIRDCGYGAKMFYTTNWSFASLENAKQALIENFSFNESIERKLRENYNNNRWAQLIRDEINAGRPVIYGATQENILNSHAFVIDGYQCETENGASFDADLFHINWGWNGYSNGWMYLGSLKETNASASDTTTWYIYNHRALFGIYPKPTCIENSSSINTIIQDTNRIETGARITLYNKIDSTAKATYTSGSEIHINPGFYAKAGSNVTIRIRKFPCDYDANATVQAIPRKPKDNVIEQKVEHNDPFSWSISPNPVTSHFIVNADKDIRAIELYSIDGRRYEWKEQKEINVSSLPNGMYLLRVHCMDNKILQTKIIKQ